MPISEPELNETLADILQELLRTHTIKAHMRIDNKIPDIVAVASGRSPIIIEAEYFPGPEVDKEAKRWLGTKLNVEGRTQIVVRVIALEYPQTLKNVSKIYLKAMMLRADIKYSCRIFQGLSAQSAELVESREDTATNLAATILEFS